MSEISGNIRVLLVEDNPGDAFLIQEHLLDDETCDYELKQASRLSEAIGLLADGHFDVILLDISLPDSHGIETVSRLQSTPNLLPPIIVLTGLKDESMARAAIQHNAQDYLLKSGLNSDVLHRSIRYAIERYRLQRDMQQIINISPNGMLVISQDQQHILFANAAAKQILAHAPDGGLHALLDVTGQLNKAQEIKLSDDCFINIRCFHTQWQGHDAYLVQLTDITEEQRLKEQMGHAQRLESLGVLAGGIAHDFNNLLTAIMGNSGLARSKLQPASPANEHLLRIEGSTRRAADLCKQMLAYSGKGEFIIQPLNLTSIVEEMLDLLQVSIAKDVILKFDLARSLPAIEADASQLQQVIMNLVINASEAIENKSGVISVATGAMHADARYLSETWLDEGLAEGHYAYLEISDTGCGMNKATMAKIFDPFFTTKFTGRGLGMSAILGIVRGHKGAVKVYSEPGRGTTFKVLLPITELSVIESETAPDKLAEWQGRGSVLVVDDEETIREVAGLMLEDMGFDVLLAENGLVAIDLYRLHQTEIVTVLLDMTMPKMNGEETFRELRRINPDVTVILSSGYNEQDATQHFLGKGLAAFIQKPYAPEDLRNIMIQSLKSQ